MDRIRNKLNKKGFTLAELLIVVAIIGVLVAVSVPIFTAQVKKAHMAANQANARSAYAAVISQMMFDGSSAATSYTYDVASGQATKDNTAESVDITGARASIMTWMADMDTLKSNGELLCEETAKQWRVRVEGDQVVGYLAIYT